MGISSRSKLWASFIWLSTLHAPVTAAVTPGTYYGAVETVYPAWFKQSFLDFGEDIAEATQAGKRVMVLFHQDGCPYCNALVERNLSQRGIESRAYTPGPYAELESMIAAWDREYLRALEG